jgi:hypothetical protein
VNSFVRHHGESIRFGYRCFDRMLCSARVQHFHFPAAVCGYLMRRHQVRTVTASLLKSISAEYHAWLESTAEQRGIPLVEPPREVRRTDWVQPYFDQLGGRDGVAVILRVREQERIAVGYPSRGNLVELAQRFINLYYFYLQHPTCGRMWLRLSPYFPFPARVCLNGHEWLAIRLRQEGIAFTQRDNAFVDCANPQRLQELADAFAPEAISAAVEGILQQWLPYFGPDDLARGYRHRLFVWQVEYCDNLIFHQQAALHRLFERLLDVNRSIGQPERLAIVFGRKQFRPDTRTGETVVKVTSLRTPVLRSGYQSTSLKQYVKDRTLLRTETTCHQLGDLKLPKDIKNLPRLREVLGQSNQRYLNAQQDVLATYVDRGQLERLRQPTISPAGRRTPGLRVDDLRLLAVWQALTCIVHLVGRGTFRTKDLLAHVQQTLNRHDYQMSQLRYDLSKLRGKGLVERLPGTHRYRLTAEGYRVGVLYCKLYHRLYAPLTAAVLAPQPHDNRLLTYNRTRLDRLYGALSDALQKLSRYIGFEAAA